MARWKPGRKGRTLTKSERDKVLREVIRHARGTGRQSWFGRLASKFGIIGEVVGLVADIIMDRKGQQGSPSDRDVTEAVHILSEAGYDIRERGSGEPTPPPIQIPRRPFTPQQPGVRVQPPPVITDPEGFPIQEHTIPIIGRDVFSPQPGLIDTRVVSAPLTRAGPGEVHPFEQEMETPDSSNVFSFTYDRQQGTLYVTYKAGADPIRTVRRTNQCTGKEYEMGVRPHVRGPMYAYGGKGKPVPSHVYESLIRARSKGGAVWKHLRVCGTQWQHQYPYRLIQGEVRAGGDHYVPRKATQRGLRVRAVPIIGGGSRESNLPERLTF